MRHAACLDDQARCLGDGHEEALDLGVRDRDGAAGGNLALEHRDDAAVRAQHVAEAHGGEHGLGRARVQLHHHLAHALRGAHDARGVHGLVGGDEDEARGAERVGRLHHVERAEHVVVQRLARARLHERHVLMRRGMEHGARTVLREHLGHAGLVAHAADLDDDLDVVVLGQQLVAQHVGVVLVDVEDDDARGRHAAQLPAELAADGAAAARDQHALAGDVAGHGAGVQDDLLAAQKVGHVHVAQPHVAYLVERELAYVGQRAQLALGLRALAVDALALLERGRGDGHDDLLDVVAINQLHDVVRGAGHLHAVDTAAALRGVVVSGHDGHAGHERVLRGHAADGERARLPRAHDERARPVTGALCRPQHALLLTHDAEYQAYAPHEEYEQKARDEEHAYGQAHVDDP